MIINNLAGGEVEITDIKRFLGGTEYDISDVYFGDKHIFESWRELESPLPITILAAGEDLIDYRIYGNTVQTGTPTPQNPIMPSGCGERTENLFDKNFEQGLYRPDDGGKGSGLRYVRSNDKIPVSPDETYTVTYTCPKEGVPQSGVGWDSYIYFWEADSSYIGYQQIMEKGNQTFTTPSNAAYVGFTIGAGSSGGGTLTPSDVSNFMLTSGSTAPTSYIPYGYKLPMLSNSTVTNIYLGEVGTTRRIKKLVLTGEENWGENGSGTNTFRGMLSLVYSNKWNAPGICSHLKYIISGISSDVEGCSCVDNNLFVRLSKTLTPNLSDFKSYLADQYAAGTPVTVWYVLAEPETAVVNEPLMKIGDYTDTISMEQAGVSIPTAAGETIIDYNPSETPAVEPEKMYIKYKPQ